MSLTQQKMDFFVDMSHELKTPLSLIIAPLAKLLSETSNAKLRDSLKSIHGNACMAKRVIREDAVAVGQQQTVYARVATNGNTPIVVAPVGVWEPEFIV